MAKLPSQARFLAKARHCSTEQDLGQWPQSDTTATSAGIGRAICKPGQDASGRADRKDEWATAEHYLAVGATTQAITVTEQSRVQTPPPSVVLTPQHTGKAGVGSQGAGRGTG